MLNRWYHIFAVSVISVIYQFMFIILYYIIYIYIYNHPNCDRC